MRVTVAVEYRAPSESRHFIAAFGNPYTLQCERASEITYWRNVKPRPKPPFPRVGVTAGLPGSLAAELGRRARGYEVRILAAPGHVPRIYDLRFVYQDASDPHVVYHVIVSDTYLHLAAAASAGQLMARRVIRATS